MARSGILIVLGSLLIAFSIGNLISASVGGPAIGAYREPRETSDQPGTDVITPSSDNSTPVSLGILGIVTTVGPLPSWTGTGLGGGISGVTAVNSNVIAECEALAVGSDGRPANAWGTSGNPLKDESQYSVRQTAMEACLEAYSYSVTMSIGSVWVKAVWWPPKLITHSGLPTGRFYIGGDAEITTSYGCLVSSCDSNHPLPPVPGGVKATRTSFWALLEKEAALYVKRLAGSQMPSGGRHIAYMGEPSPDQWINGVSQFYSNPSGPIATYNIQKYGQLWGKDAVVQSCGGFWFPFTAPFGCVYFHNRYKTQILSISSYFENIPSQGQSDYNPITDMKTTVEMETATDPFGVADDYTIFAIPRLPCGPYSGQGTKYGESIEGWSCNELVIEYQGVLGKDFDGVLKPGDVYDQNLVYANLIYKFHMVCGPKTCENAPALPNWGEISAKMESLSWIERLAFAAYVNGWGGVGAHSGGSYCDSACIARFSVTDQSVWPKWNLEALVFSRYFGYGIESGGFTGASRPSYTDWIGAYSAMIKASSGQSQRTLSARSWLVDIAGKPLYAWDYRGDTGIKPYTLLCSDKSSYVCYNPVPQVWSQSKGDRMAAQEVSKADVKPTRTPRTSVYEDYIAARKAVTSRDWVGGRGGIGEGEGTRSLQLFTVTETDPSDSTRTIDHVFIIKRSIGLLDLVSSLSGETDGTVVTYEDNCRIAYIPLDDGNYRVKMSCGSEVGMLELVEMPRYVTISSPQIAWIDLSSSDRLYFSDLWLPVFLVGVLVLAIGIFFRRRSKRRSKDSL